MALGFMLHIDRRGSRNFSKGGGGLRRKFLKEKCLLIHVLFIFEMSKGGGLQPP